MDAMHENIIVALEGAVAEHVGVGAASGIRPSYAQNIAATIRAACEACASGEWAPPEIKSRAAAMEKVRADRMAAEAGPKPAPAPDGGAPQPSDG